MSALIPRPGILDVAPYIGGEAQAEGVTRLIRLASNEGAFGPSPAAMIAYKELAGDIHRYPDGGCVKLCQALGKQFGVDSDRIVCGSGSDELLSLLARAYAGPGDEVLYSAHGFLMYPIAARTVGATPVSAPERDLTADVDALLAAVTPRTRILFLANPNNPTGSYLTRGQLARLHAGLPGNVLLVVDAAYSEFVTEADYSDGLELVEAAENVVMTRTFSKMYGLGGLRLGWCYAKPEVIGVLNRVRGPFNVTSAAQAAGVAALADTDFVEKCRTHNTQCREWFSAQLRQLGLTVYPSVGNFVLVNFAPWGQAEAVRLHLKARGILIRQMGVYGLPGCLRMTIGTQEEMGEVLAAVAGYPRG
ncbi:Histidinol-phosphate aminotransferase [uncultured Gammaproteobacteria bacterium]